MLKNQSLGKFGEDLAKKYLLKNGYKIIANNIKSSYQEIDILAYFKGIYVFVEVKTRSSDIFGKAEESLNSKKNNNLKKAIMQYININKIDPNNVRLDLIAINLSIDKKIANIKHFKDIF